MKPKTICISQIKGGVGKTATACHLAVALAEKGPRTLLIDLDPQGNATSMLGLSEEQATQASIAEVLTPKAQLTLPDIVQPTHRNNLQVAPGNIGMARKERELYLQGQRLYFLDGAIRKAKSHWDFIVIDTPPHIGAYTEAAIYASDLVIAPMPAENGALQGWQDLYGTIQELNEFTEAPTAIVGLQTKYDGRTKKTNAAIKAAILGMGLTLLDARIGRDERINQSALLGATLFDIQPSRPVCAAYRDAAEEITALFIQQQETNEVKHVA